MINLKVLIQIITGVYTIADCARACLDNYIATGECRAWDWYTGICELASGGLSQNDTNVDYTRPQVTHAFYGELFQPNDVPTDYAEEIYTGYQVTDVTAMSTSTQNNQKACRMQCENKNWPNGQATTFPSQCGSWTYDPTSKSCTLYPPSNFAQVQAVGGNTVSGQIVRSTAVKTNLLCPTGYEATSGSLTCPTVIDSYGNVLPAFLIQSTGVVGTYGFNVGWNGMCTFNSQFQDNNGNFLTSQIYYNPSSITATCCL